MYRYRPHQYSRAEQAYAYGSFVAFFAALWLGLTPLAWVLAAVSALIVVRGRRSR